MSHANVGESPENSDSPSAVTSEGDDWMTKPRLSAMLTLIPVLAGFSVSSCPAARASLERLDPSRRRVEHEIDVGDEAQLRMRRSERRVGFVETRRLRENRRNR